MDNSINFIVNLISLEPLFQIIQQLASYHITVPNMKLLFRLLQKRSDTIGNEKVCKKNKLLVIPRAIRI
jgi:hypothetical protein